MVAGTLLIYAFVYTRVLASNNTKKIWVPPKAKPQLPFGLGPPAEKVKAEEYTETTYKEHEINLLKEAAQSLVMGAGMSLFMVRMILSTLFCFCWCLANLWRML